MMYDTRRACSSSQFQTLFTRSTYFSRRKAAMTIVAFTGHSFDNGARRTASEKDRRETKETGKVRGIVLTRFTALD